MLNFFVEKFELDYHSNELIIRSIEEQEDLVSNGIRSIFSHILNFHHIWLARLKQEKPQSEPWDVLPVSYLSDLNRLNFLETEAYIKDFDSQLYTDGNGNGFNTIDKKVLDVLFHILQHSAYHRGQVIKELKLNKLNFPDMQWISIN